MVDGFLWNSSVSHDCELIIHYLLIMCDRLCLCVRLFDWFLCVLSVWLRQCLTMCSKRSICSIDCMHRSAFVCLSVYLLIILHSCVVYLILASIQLMNSISSFACAHITQPKRLQHNPISTRLQFFIHSLHFLCIATQQPENVNEKNFSCTCSLFFIHSCKDRCPSFGNANEYENPNETRVLMADTQIFCRTTLEWKFFKLQLLRSKTKFATV